jgi:hypothetical protein
MAPRIHFVEKPLVTGCLTSFREIVPEEAEFALWNVMLSLGRRNHFSHAKGELVKVLLKGGPHSGCM